MSSAPRNINYGNYPLKDIQAPHPHDVLCGRGGGSNNHIGNSHWRMLVAANKQLYITLPKRQKMLLSRSIVNAVRSQNPPGRFLQKDTKTNQWFDVGDQRAQEKTSQALREGAPDIRKKVASHTEPTTNDDAVESTDNSTTSADGEPTKNKNSSSENNNRTTTNGTSQAAAPNPPTSASTSTSTASSSANGQPPPEPSTTPIPASPTAPAAPTPHPSTTTPQTMHNPFGGMPYGGFPTMNYPGMAAATMFPGAAGMPQLFAPGNMGAPQGMMLFAGPNMQPVQVFPTMVMNEHGMMVPGMSMMPTTYHSQMAMASSSSPPGLNQNSSNTVPAMMPPPQQQVSAAGSATTLPASNVHEQRHGTDSKQQHYQQEQQQQQQHYHQHHQQNQQQQYPQHHHEQHHHQQNEQQQRYQKQHQYRNGTDSNDNVTTPTFDEFIASPPDGLYGGTGFSFGSAIPDVDMMKLQATGASFGSAMSYKYANNSQHHQRQQQQQHPQQDGIKNQELDDHTPIPLSGLEPTGISFGDTSMMSTGTKLEAGGPSFGTMMSLEQIGTSFGSLTLDPAGREMLYQTLELTGGGPEIPPMFHSEAKATGNLLECSDTESEDSQSKPELTAQNSQAWEKMRTSVAQTQLHQSQSKSTVDSADLMPPPPATMATTSSTSAAGGNGYAMNGTVLSIPTTNFQRDFSQLSAWGHEDDDDDDGDTGHDGDDDEAVAAPPPLLVKQGSDGEDALIGFLSQKQS